MIDLTREKIMQIEAGISWNGLDRYLTETGDLQGTELERYLDTYLAAREALLQRLKDLDIEY